MRLKLLENRNVEHEVVQSGEETSAFVVDLFARRCERHKIAAVPLSGIAVGDNDSIAREDKLVDSIPQLSWELKQFAPWRHCELQRSRRLAAIAVWGVDADMRD